MAKLDMDAVIAAAQCEEEYLGFCIACGAEAYDVEPDARQYECDECGKHKVYGAQEILLAMVVR
jgi:predicted RNA-binding Zn-ribbon protein involved in translation (DUF1610 family)